MALDWNKEISFSGLKKKNKDEGVEKPPKTSKAPKLSRSSKPSKPSKPTEPVKPATPAAPVREEGNGKVANNGKADKAEKGSVLSKPISFGKGGKGSAASKSSYPAKTYINLAPQTTSSFNPRKSIPYIIIAVVVAVLVIKFGVLDMFGQVNARQQALDQANATREQILGQLTNYNEVLMEYQAYEANSLTVDPNMVSALDALDLVDRVIAPSAGVKSLSLENNVMSLNLTNITLDGIGALQGRLLNEDMVVNVSVSTAATQSTAPGDVSAAMIVTLQRVIEE